MCLVEAVSKVPRWCPQGRSIFKKTVIKPYHLHFSSANNTSHNALFPHPLRWQLDIRSNPPLKVLEMTSTLKDFQHLRHRKLRWSENEMLKHYDYVTMRYDLGVSEEYSMATERSFDVWDSKLQWNHLMEHICDPFDQSHDDSWDPSTPNTAAVSPWLLGYPESMMLLFSRLIMIYLSQLSVLHIFRAVQILPVRRGERGYEVEGRAERVVGVVYWEIDNLDNRSLKNLAVVKIVPTGALRQRRSAQTMPLQVKQPGWSKILEPSSRSPLCSEYDGFACRTRD